MFVFEDVRCIEDFCSVFDTGEVETNLALISVGAVLAIQICKAYAEGWVPFVDERPFGVRLVPRCAAIAFCLCRPEVIAACFIVSVVLPRGGPVLTLSTRTESPACCAPSP